MNIKDSHLNLIVNYSTELIKKSSEITLKYFSGKIKHKLKENLTPVTIADIKCEEFIIRNILKKFPKHNIYSEESGIKMQDSEFTWFIDPIDGTKNFMRGFPFWGTLLALENKGEIIFGIIYMPALGDLIYAAKGKGCWKNNKRIKVSNVSKLNAAYVLHGSFEHFNRYQPKFKKLLNETFYSRGFGDCHGHSLVIDGRADVMLDPKVAPYDIAPMKICVEEAGGILTDFD